jgi:hypothetical protein
VTVWMFCTIVTKCHLVSDLFIIFGKIQFIVPYILLVLTLNVIHIGCYPFQPLLAVHHTTASVHICVWSRWPSVTVFSNSIIAVC